MADGQIYRMTNQRRVIMEVLKGVKTHPTADQVYEMVRKQLPKISLGTVYRNLEILSDLSMIQKIEVGGTQKRFDGDVEEHYHVRCRICGRVEDLPSESVTFDGLEKLYSGADGYTDLTHKIELIGICPECKNRGGRDN